MTRPLHLIPLVLALIGVPTAGHAQDVFDRWSQAALAGIPGIHVVVEQADTREDSTCGVSTSTLRAEAIRTVLDGQVKVDTADGVRPYLYVSPITLYFESDEQCITALSVELRAQAFARLTWAEQPRIVSVLLASDTVLITSRKSNHSARVLAEERRLVETVTTAIRLANQ
jgi:hypothetical protein